MAEELPPEVSRYIDEHIIRPFRKADGRIDEATTVRGVYDIMSDLARRYRTAIERARRYGPHQYTVRDIAYDYFTHLCYRATDKAREIFHAKVSELAAWVYTM